MAPRLVSETSNYFLLPLSPDPRMFEFFSPILLETSPLLDSLLRDNETTTKRSNLVPKPGDQDIR